MKREEVFQVREFYHGFIMVRSVIIAVFFIFTLSLTGYGEKVADLSMVMKPFFVTADQGRMYITEEESRVHIFKFENNKIKFLKTFGTKGEGSGEFRFIHGLTIKDDYLEIPTYGKYARFTFDGKLIEEKKLPFRVFKNSIKRVGKNYVVRDLIYTPQTLDAKIRLYGPDLKLIKELETESEKFSPIRINIAGNYLSSLVKDNHIYIVKADKETVIKKYDSGGKYLWQIKLPLKPFKMDPELKRKIRSELIAGVDKQTWKIVEKRIYYPDYTPGLNWIGMKGKWIIARTYGFKGDKAEFVFFDLKGKELKRVFLYDTGRTSQGIKFCFYKNKYYYLKENYDDEIWELFVTKVF